MDIRKITGRITLPIAIIILTVVLGVGFYINGKQQFLQLQQKRKEDCLNIYKTESDKWPNVSGWFYSESDNTCHIVYKDPNPKSDAKCEKLYPVYPKGRNLNINNWIQNDLCKNGEFERIF